MVLKTFESPLACSFPGGAVVKNLATSAGDTRDVGSIPGSGRSPGEREWQHTPIFLPGEFHGQRSLMGHTPWSCKELATIEQLTLSLSVKDNPDNPEAEEI